MISFFSRHSLKLLLSLALVTGALVFPDFGISWDEDYSIITGQTNYNYVFGNDTSIEDFTLKDYGVAFELPAAIVINKLGLEDSRDIYLTRRILTYLLFTIACCCIFLLADKLYNDKLAASAAFLLLWLHPQIFSHAFFNSKDIPFLSFLVITLYLLFTATQKKKWWLFCVAGAAAGLLTGTRIPGVIYVILGAGWILSESLFLRKAGKGIIWSSLFFFCSAVSLYICWPILWSRPVNNFIKAFSNMSKFSWDLTVLYGNEYFYASKLPWDYAPAMFVLGTPLLFLIIGACGILIPFGTVIARRKFDFDVRAGFFLLLCFALPVVSIIVMNSVVYDGWRHLYFIYAPFVLLSAGALHKLSLVSRKAALVSLAILVIPVCVYHVNAHPLQHIHFNLLTKSSGKDLKNDYELDYWGVSYKQGLEFILSHDSAQVIPIAAQNTPVEFNVKLLAPAQRKRVKIVPITEASYFLTNYRWHRQEYDDMPVKLELIKSFKVCGTSVQGVYRVAR